MLVKYYVPEFLNLPDVIGINGKMFNCNTNEKAIYDGQIAYYEGKLGDEDLFINIIQDGEDFMVTAMLNDTVIYKDSTYDDCDCCDDECDSKDVLDILGEACTAIENKIKPVKKQADINVNVNITSEKKDGSEKKKKLQQLLEQLLSEED